MLVDVKHNWNKKSYNNNNHFLFYKNNKNYINHKASHSSSGIALLSERKFIKEHVIGGIPRFEYATSKSYIVITSETDKK